MLMKPLKYNLMLADDDEDDCAFFRDVLAELPLSTSLITVNDGVRLMKHLSDSHPQHLPDILFLDLNMPRKSGFECLSEIKVNDNLNHIPIIIFSTSLDLNIVDLLYEKGAIYYIRKPGDFAKLRKVVYDVIAIAAKTGFTQPSRDHFIFEP